MDYYNSHEYYGLYDVVFSYETADLTMYEGATIDYFGIEKSINNELAPMIKSYENAVRSGDKPRAKQIAVGIAKLIRDYKQAIDRIDIEKANIPSDIISWFVDGFVRGLVPMLVTLAGVALLTAGLTTGGIGLMGIGAVLTEGGYIWQLVVSIISLVNYTTTIYREKQEGKINVATFNMTRANVVSKLDGIERRMMYLSKNM